MIMTELITHDLLNKVAGSKREISSVLTALQGWRTDVECFQLMCSANMLICMVQLISNSAYLGP